MGERIVAWFEWSKDSPAVTRLYYNTTSKTLSIFEISVYCEGDGFEHAGGAWFNIWTTSSGYDDTAYQEHLTNEFQSIQPGEILVNKDIVWLPPGYAIYFLFSEFNTYDSMMISANLHG